MLSVCELEISIELTSSMTYVEEGRVDSTTDLDDGSDLQFLG